MVCLGCQISGEPLEGFEENGISARLWKEQPVFRTDSPLGNADNRELRRLLSWPRSEIGRS